MSCVCGESDCGIPQGFCHCGCGGRVKRSPRTRGERGHVDGGFNKCIFRHQPKGRIRYTVNDSGCWIWDGAIAAETGYGTCQKKMAHRVVYEREVGPIPDGLVLDHLCRVRACVNPSHLEPVTIGENARRGSHTKLSRYEVEEIRRLRAFGINKTMIGAMFKISPQHVYMIADRRVWKDVA